MGTGKIINIDCQCGYHLFRYYKSGKGKMIKCFIGALVEDNVGLQHADTYSKPICPQCHKELGIIMMIHGEPALKINQGTIKTVRI